MYKIHNEVFCLSINELGAELEELSIKGISVLWKRNELWQAQSPILFPIIGNVKDGYYIYKDKIYPMKAHGFLKEERFEIVSHKESSITLKSKFHPDTLKQYPFFYEFYISYILKDNQIKIAIEIKNLGNDEMLFSIGLHPGLDYDGLKKIIGDDITLWFSSNQIQSVEFDPIFVNKIKPQTIDSSITLSHISNELKKKKTICYQGVSQVDIKAQTGGLRMKHTMPYLAFWQSRPEDPKFLCIEPWYGLPDETTTNHQLTQKKGILRLGAKDTFTTEVEISFLEGVKE